MNDSVQQNSNNCEDNKVIEKKEAANLVLQKQIPKQNQQEIRQPAVNPVQRNTQNYVQLNFVLKELKFKIKQKSWWQKLIKSPTIIMYKGQPTIKALFPPDAKMYLIHQWLKKRLSKTLGKQFMSENTFSLHYMAPPFRYENVNLEKCALFYKYNKYIDVLSYHSF